MIASEHPFRQNNEQNQKNNLYTAQQPNKQIEVEQHSTFIKQPFLHKNGTYYISIPKNIEHDPNLALFAKEIMLQNELIKCIYCLDLLQKDKAILTLAIKYNKKFSRQNLINYNQQLTLKIANDNIAKQIASINESNQAWQLYKDSLLRYIYEINRD